MFLWCKGELPDELEGIKGSKFGVDDLYFRLNIGCSDIIFNKFIELYE